MPNVLKVNIILEKHLFCPRQMLVRFFKFNKLTPRDKITLMFAVLNKYIRCRFSFQIKLDVKKSCFNFLYNNFFLSWFTHGSGNMLIFCFCLFVWLFVCLVVCLKGLIHTQYDETMKKEAKDCLYFYYFGNLIVCLLISNVITYLLSWKYK